MTLQYAILVFEGESEQRVREEGGAEYESVHAGYLAYTAALVEAGVLRGGEQLDLPHTATTVTAKSGQPLQVQDGPFADTKDQLAGMFVIEVANLDEAIAWAARCPAAATGRVEVRPLVPPP